MDVATSDFETREKGNAKITKEYFLQDNYFRLHNLSTITSEYKSCLLNNYQIETLQEQDDSLVESENENQANKEELESSSISAKDICEDNDVLIKVRISNPDENESPLGSENKSIGEFK